MSSNRPEKRIPGHGPDDRTRYRVTVTANVGTDAEWTPPAVEVEARTVKGALLAAWDSHRQETTP